MRISGDFYIFYSSAANHVLLFKKCHYTLKKSVFLSVSLFSTHHSHVWPTTFYKVRPPSTVAHNGHKNCSVVLNKFALFHPIQLQLHPSLDTKVGEKSSFGHRRD